MRKIVFAVAIIGMLSCVNSSNLENSSNLSSIAILRTNTSTLEQTSSKDFISKNSYLRLKSSMEDDREL